KGSLGFDLATAVEITMIDTQAVKIPMTAWGPLHESKYQLGALLLGRYSAGMKGIIVIPRLIDADFTGQIQIMAYTLNPPLVIPTGSRIAQLIPLANLSAQMLAPLPEEMNNPEERGNQGFGSTGDIVCLTLNTKERPVKVITATHGSDSITFKALLDTGAGITILS
ncbi:POK9 protein, partial [Pteruthius melanotis]|nr:POK9 protein [Pteruthius melanotis]